LSRLIGPPRKAPKVFRIKAPGLFGKPAWSSAVLLKKSLAAAAALRLTPHDYRKKRVSDSKARGIC